MKPKAKKIRTHHSLILIILLPFYLFICCGKPYTKGSNIIIKPYELIIDATIKKNEVFKTLNKQIEIFDGPEVWMNKADPSIKRTSAVKYSFGKHPNFNKDKYTTMNNCRAKYFKSDTLLIRIGINSGFSGHGFLVYYKNSKFSIEPYTFTDAIIEGYPEPTYMIVYQHLTLDKEKYLVGDSLFGKVNFKSIENAVDGSVIEHIGDGYFRTKVERF